MTKKMVATICGLAAAFTVYQAHALVMGPATFEVSLSPGAKVVADYYVQNDTPSPVHVKAEAENWFTDSYNYDKLKIGDWVRMDPVEFDLNPKEIKKVKLYITVPADAKGEIVAQIFFSSDIKAGTVEEGIVKARLGGVLYVAIKGTEEVSAGIEDVKVSKITERGKEKLKVEALVRNRGNVHIRPTGGALITNEKGEDAAKADLEAGYSVAPKSECTFNAFLENQGLKPGKYDLSVTLDYGKLYNIQKTASIKKELDVDEKGEVILK